MRPGVRDRTSLTDAQTVSDSKTQRKMKIKLFKLVGIVSVVALAASIHLQGAVDAQDQPGRLFEIAGMFEPLEQRIGVDDGAAFVVHFAGDTRGTLDTCG